jgi:hypothetical protein
VFLPDEELQASPLNGLGQGTYNPFENALLWENISEYEMKPEILVALPTFFHSGRSWFYGCFWADQDFSFKDLQYSIQGDRLGNQTIKLNGNFSSINFLICGGVLTGQDYIILDQKNQYPFPSTYPEELEEFLMPGKNIPGGDAAINKLAQSLIQDDSRGDMYKTIRDIVYSKLLQNMALESKDIGLLSDKELGEEDALVDSVKDVYYVLNNMKGDRHSKSRLICALARASGIPARIVMSLGGSVWSQVWLSGLGWVSVDASYPVYDYIRPLRTYMPKVFSKAEHAIASVSGRDDDTGRILWDSRVKAYYVNNSPSELKNYSQISMAKILFTKIISTGKVPDNSMIQIDRDLFVFARQMPDSVFLVFQDGTGKQIEKKQINFDGLSCFVNINDRFFWNFIPRRIYDILVIENIECRISQEPASELVPMQELSPAEELNVQ